MAVCRILARATAQAVPSVAARKDGEQWLAWIACGEFIIEMDGASARQLARDIDGVCDVIDGVHPAQFLAPLHGLTSRDTNGCLGGAV